MRALCPLSSLLKTPWSAAAIAIALIGAAPSAPSAAPMMLITPIAEVPGVTDRGYAHENTRLVPSNEHPDGVLLTLYAENRREYLDIRIPTDPEEVSQETLAEMRTFLRCQRTHRKHRIDRRLLAALARVAEQFPGRTIDIISGYRARPYGVRGSKHFRGRAVDFRVRGVPVHKVRDWVWQNFDHVGVGHYRHQQFVHLDIRPKSPKAGWDQRRAGRKYRNNPYWTKKGTKTAPQIETARRAKAAKAAKRSKTAKSSDKRLQSKDAPIRASLGSNTAVGVL